MEMQMQETEDTLIVTKKKKHFTGSSKDRGESTNEIQDRSWKITETEIQSN